MNFCKAEIEDLLKKGIIRKSRSPWSCPTFYVQKNAEIKRGVPRLVINYKPLKKILEWVRYPIPNKKDLINRLDRAVVFSKFNMKSGFWQIQIRESDRYKTAFTTPFGHYEWNVMPFGLKMHPLNSKISWMRYSIHSPVLPLSTLMMSSSFQNPWTNIRNTFEHFSR